jgi:hypothetical protein
MISTTIEEKVKNLRDIDSIFELFELLGYKGKTTLRFLRHRKSYSGGDFQRCHNQAEFMKSQIIKILPFFQKTGGELLLRTAYSIIWTDMSYSMARRIIMRMIKTKLHLLSNKIELKMKPNFSKRLNKKNEIPDNFSMEKKVKELYNSISSDEKDKSRKFDMFKHLNKIIKKYEPLLGVKDSLIIKKLSDLFERKLWYQIEEISVRKHIHRKLSDILITAYKNLSKNFLAEKIERDFELEYSIKNIWQLPDEDEIIENGKVKVENEEITQ